jgi:hypothetical protein
VALHRKVAEAIESLHAASLDDHLPALAHHWARASAPAAETSRAVEYASRAGNRARAQLAHHEAVDWYRQALELLDVAGTRPSDPQRIGLLIDLGDAQRRAGDAVHRDTLLQAAALAQAEGDADLLVRAALANDRMFSRTSSLDAERVAVLEAAVAASDPGDSPDKARLLANLADEIAFSSPSGRHRELAGEALAMARRLGDPVTLAHVLTRRGSVMVATIESHREIVELAAIAERLDDPVQRLWAEMWMALTRPAIGEPIEPESYDQSIRLADDLGHAALRWTLRLVQAVALRIAGRLEEAEARAGEALEFGRAAGFPDALLLHNSVLFSIR